MHYAIGDGFDGSEATRHPGSDWARLDLAVPVPPSIAPLPLAHDLPAPGTAIVLPGYNRDRTEVLMADPSCHITRHIEIRGERLLAHDCSATRGTSGGPLLAERDHRWEVVGINIAASPTANIALPMADLGAGR